MTIYHWHIETANYSFDAYGRTAAECRTAMQLAWRKHQAQTGASWTFSEIASDKPRRIESGTAYRDDAILIRREDVQDYYIHQSRRK